MQDDKTWTMDAGIEAAMAAATTAQNPNPYENATPDAVDTAAADVVAALAPTIHIEPKENEKQETKIADVGVSKEDTKTEDVAPTQNNSSKKQEEEQDMNEIFARTMKLFESVGPLLSAPVPPPNVSKTQESKNVNGFASLFKAMMPHVMQAVSQPSKLASFSTLLQNGLDVLRPKSSGLSTENSCSQLPHVSPPSPTQSTTMTESKSSVVSAPAVSAPAPVVSAPVVSAPAKSAPAMISEPLSMIIASLARSAMAPQAAPQAAAPQGAVPQGAASAVLSAPLPTETPSDSMNKPEEKTIARPRVVNSKARFVYPVELALKSSTNPQEQLRAVQVILDAQYTSILHKYQIGLSVAHLMFGDNVRKLVHVINVLETLYVLGKHAASKQNTAHELAWILKLLRPVIFQSTREFIDFSVENDIVFSAMMELPLYKQYIHCLEGEYELYQYVFHMGEIFKSVFTSHTDGMLKRIGQALGYIAPDTKPVAAPVAAAVAAAGAPAAAANGSINQNTIAINVKPQDWNRAKFTYFKKIIDGVLTPSNVICFYCEAHVDENIHPWRCLKCYPDAVVPAISPTAAAPSPAAAQPRISYIEARVSSEIRDSPAFVAKGSQNDSPFINTQGVLRNCILGRPVADMTRQDFRYGKIIGKANGTATPSDLRCYYCHGPIEAKVLPWRCLRCYPISPSFPLDVPPLITESAAPSKGFCINSICYAKASEVPLDLANSICSKPDEVQDNVQVPAAGQGAEQTRAGDLGSQLGTKRGVCSTDPMEQCFALRQTDNSSFHKPGCHHKEPLKAGKKKCKCKCQCKHPSDLRGLEPLRLIREDYEKEEQEKRNQETIQYIRAVAAGAAAKTKRPMQAPTKETKMQAATKETEEIREKLMTQIRAAVLEQYGWPRVDSFMHKSPGLSTIGKRENKTASAAAEAESATPSETDTSSETSENEKAESENEKDKSAGASEAASDDESALAFELKSDDAKAKAESESEMDTPRAVEKSNEEEDTENDGETEKESDSDIEVQVWDKPSDMLKQQLQLSERNKKVGKLNGRLPPFMPLEIQHGNSKGPKRVPLPGGAVAVYNPLLDRQYTHKCKSVLQVPTRRARPMTARAMSTAMSTRDSRAATRAMSNSDSKGATKSPMAIRRAMSKLAKDCSTAKKQSPLLAGSARRLLMFPTKPL